jgi:hypothetical protein
MIGVLTSDAYPANIKALAGDVLEGKKGIDAYDAAVAVYDATREKAASNGAQAESAAQGAVSAEAPAIGSPEQKAVNDAWAAQIAEAKARADQAAKEVK